MNYRRPSVDLRRYAGLWYEIAQFACPVPEGLRGRHNRDVHLEVQRESRSCECLPVAKGKTKEAKGTAKLADKKGPNSKLKVTFFWPFYGDYWILDLDPDYRWAMVGTPDRKYLWFLSRTPQISEELYRKLVEDAKGEGLRNDRLIRTRHNTQ